MALRKIPKTVPVTSGLSLFTAAGLVSLISFFRSRMKFKLLFAIEKTAIIFWVAATFIGVMTSVFAWGGINHFISTSIDDHKIISLLGIGLAMSVWAIMGSAGKILHPDNPFALDEKAKIGINAYHTTEKSRWTR